MRAVQSQQQWLVSPRFDLCFFANLWWPLVVLMGVLLGETDSWFGFWQIYFLTTPHRWLTLFLVAIDPDRRAGKSRWLLGIALLAALAVLGTWLITGALLCLALIDYLWNAWHFGAQHGGIARMYSRRAAQRASPLQTWSLRVLVVYTSVRLAGWSTGWIEVHDEGALLLSITDGIVATICAALLAISLLRSPQITRGWWTYVASVATLYCAILLAVNLRSTGWVAVLVAAGAAFHAVEYLAIVTYYAKRRETSGSAGLFQTMARQWTVLLAWYLTLLGVLAFSADQSWRNFWLGINLWAAFLHYAYDGLIWKLRERGTASTLGVELAPAATTPGAKT